MKLHSKLVTIFSGKYFEKLNIYIYIYNSYKIYIYIIHIYIYIYIYMKQFAVPLKLALHCKSIIFQLKIFKKKYYGYNVQYEKYN